MRQDVTKQVCPKCHEVLDECLCDIEEPDHSQGKEWDHLSNTWKTGETAL